MPATTSAAETDHGQSSNEFEPRLPAQVRGRLRGGGPLVDLETDSGDIDSLAS